MSKYLYLLFIVSICNAGFRVSDQGIWVQPESSFLHFTGSYAVACTLDKCSLKWYEVDLISIGLGVLWEVKDGFVPYEKYGIWGGEGLSLYDIQCDIMGVTTNRLISALIKHVRKKYVEGDSKQR